MVGEEALGEPSKTTAHRSSCASSLLDFFIHSLSLTTMLP